VEFVTSTRHFDCSILSGLLTQCSAIGAQNVIRFTLVVTKARMQRIPIAAESDRLIVTLGIPSLTEL
jgi:hypothetical protein